jgi:peptide/nickel transport system ATP-binding protein
MTDLLRLENLSVHLLANQSSIPVLQDINFSVAEGEILAVVGESGCGKSLTSLALTRLLPEKVFSYHSGKIFFQNKNVLEFSETDLYALRGGEIAYIFQDPFTSLNPIKKIKDQIIEPYIIHISQNKKEAIEKAEFLLGKVGITDIKDRMEAYPGQMSGGILQRTSIAMSLMCNPKLLVADEPTSALDVTIQSQLVDLLMEIRRENKMSILFISHDIGLVSSISDRIIIMYAGQIVESGTVDSVMDTPLHPYTTALLGAIPTIGDISHKRLDSIPGIVPAPIDFPKGCHFHARCTKAMDICKTKNPNMRDRETQLVRCFLYEGEKTKNA